MNDEFRLLHSFNVQFTKIILCLHDELNLLELKFIWLKIMIIV